MLKKIFPTSILFFALAQPIQGQQQGASPSTVSALKQQLAVARQIPAKDSLLQELVNAYIWQKPDSALFYARQRIQLAQATNTPQREAYATGYYGYILGLMGNYPQAIEYLLKGTKIAEKANDPGSLSFLYDALSNTYIEQGNFSRALFYSDQFKNISIRNSDTLLYGWLLTKGVLYERFNHLDSALFYLKKAFNFDLLENGEITRERVLLTLGNVYAKENNYPAALHYYRMAVNMALAKDQHINLADALNGLAQLYDRKGQLDSGMHYANEALQASQSTSYMLGQLTSYGILSDLYKKNGNRDSMIKYLELTIGLKDSLFNQQKEREVQNIAFKEELRLRDLAEVQAKLRNNVKIYTLIIGVFVLLIIAAILYRNNQNKHKAYVMLQKQKAETEQAKTSTEQALNELKAAQTQLIQREKMASLGELTAGIAHEIQNPLNFVNNFSDGCLELTSELKEQLNQLPLQEKQKNMILNVINDIAQSHQRISHHGKRADAIVKNMLQHSGSVKGEKKPTDINLLIDEYLRLSYHGFLAKDKTFDPVLNTHFGADIGKVSVVPQEIGKVLLNLFNNAFYFTSKKRMDLDDVFKPTISVTTKKSNGRVEIIVWDNGTGIPEAIVEKIYQPFFTTKPTGDGTGLGLSFSYDIVTKGYGGEIKVNSKEGEFTEFTVSLPV